MTYSTLMVTRARELHRAGWNLQEVARLVAEEFALPRVPTRTTVRCWVDDAYAAKRRRRNAAAKRAQRRDAGITWLYQGANDDTKWHRIQTLDANGLAIRDICTLMRLDYGLTLTYGQVRHALAIGEPPPPLRPLPVTSQEAA